MLDRTSGGPGNAAPRLAGGALLVLICWALSWHLEGLRSHVLFFPLWAGYILLADGLVELRRGASILSRSPRGFVALFVASVPIWWLFELLNRRVGNWEYLGGDRFGSLEYAFWASLSFSTVVPAVFETAELLSTFGIVKRLEGRPRSSLGSRRAGLVLLGLAMLTALLWRPRLLYPLLWVWPILVFDPIAHAVGRPSILGRLERRDARAAACLALGALTCGFFWEMWNYHSYPKWIYHVPGLDFAHLFEMPALGYLGYLPFGVSLYPMVYLLIGDLAPRLVTGDGSAAETT